MIYLNNLQLNNIPEQVFFILVFFIIFPRKEKIKNKLDYNYILNKQ